MSEHEIALKNPTGWFAAAGREIARVLALLSDGGFKVYMPVCLTADRCTGRMRIVHGDISRYRRTIVVTWLHALASLNNSGFEGNLANRNSGAGPGDLDGFIY